MKLMKKVGWGKTRIMRQMLTVSVICLLPLLVVGVFLLWNSGDLLNKHYLELLEADNRRVKAVLSETTRQAYSAAEQVWYDDNVAQLLKTDYTRGEEFIAAANSLTLLDNLVYQSKAYSKILIYTDNPTFTDYKQFRVVTEQIRQTDWYQRATESITPFWTSIGVENIPVQYSNLSLVRAINLPGCDYRAVAVLTLNDSYIRGSVDFGGGIDVISVDGGGVVYSSRSKWYGMPMPLPSDDSDSVFRYSGRQELDGREYFAVVSALQLYMTNSRLYVGTIESSGISNSRSLLTLWWSLLVLSLVIPLAALVFFVRYFAGRVSLLRAEIHKARSRNYDMVEKFSGNDELTEVYQDLCFMVADIKQMDARMYEAELNEKELRNTQQLMEYKMLASQINPHYLYNTLETIRMKALTAGDRPVADSIKLLGKTLHYVFENTGTAFTVLQKELDHVANYLSIQKLRFGDRINYEICISPEVDPETYPILPLLLQPVVENAVVHGLESISGVGILRISIERTENGHMQITVSDNGIGMTARELAEIREKLEQSGQTPQSGIALYNIRQRIRLRYGEGYGLTVESSQGEGTTVILDLPGNAAAQERV